MQKVELFSNRLYIAIKESGLSQTKVAELTGISRSLLNKYIKGVNGAGNLKIQQIAKILNVNPVWLMGYDVSKAPIISSSSDLTSDECDLLNIYRRLPYEKKKVVLELVNQLK